MRSRCELRTIVRLLFFGAGLLAALSIPGMSNTIPNGPSDGLCTPSAPGGGPTICIVNEGQGDLLGELLILDNSKGAITEQIQGPVFPLFPLMGMGDNTDWITNAIVSADTCNGLTVLPGQIGSCTFNETFFTGTPGDPDDNTIKFKDGFSGDVVRV
jgi:hypothetical protein